MSEIIVHYGMPFRSGRYPWGSGGNDPGTIRSFLADIEALSAKGLSEKEIAAALADDMSIKELRNQKALARAELTEIRRQSIVAKKEAGQSIAGIAKEMALAEQTVRDLLKPLANIKYRTIKLAGDVLKALVEKFGYVDVGEGTEIYMGLTRTKMDNVLTLLANQGYVIHKPKQEQLSAPGKKTTMMVLTKPDVDFVDVLKNKDKITIPYYTLDTDGSPLIKQATVKNMSSDRILVKYKEDGGLEKDGIIELRAGAPELNLNGSRYAQVRISVDDTHFMKGMAYPVTDMPEGIDAIYYTSKPMAKGKMEALKPHKKEGVTQFGSLTIPNTYIGPDGKKQFGVVNILGTDEESLAVEGSWENWSKSLASQMLSKQSSRLAKTQLDQMTENFKAELADIQTIKHPIVKELLLKEFADKVDRAAVDLKAAALPGQKTKVMLPDPGLKPNEAFLPDFSDGDVVSLIRYPHGGKFEIPTLVVNNRRSKLRKTIGSDLVDAIGVHPNTAEILSGADFDGDTVLVIPNKRGQIATAPPLQELRNWDHRAIYAAGPTTKMTTQPRKERMMGDVSNLITDMSIKGAPPHEIGRAVKHSMVVIDAVNHELDVKRSYQDHGIALLKQRYQGGTDRGASTLVSKASGELRIPHRYDRYDIDPITGKKLWTYSGQTFVDEVGRVRPRQTKTTKMDYVEDAYELSSGTRIEGVYAGYANNMKTLARSARKASLNTGKVEYNRTAKQTYEEQVNSLDRKLKASVQAKPIERKAQVVAETIYKNKVAVAKQEGKDMSYKDKTEAKGRSIVLARTRLGARRPVISITPREWEAIEMGAISATKLRKMLLNADMDQVREYATPRIKGTPLSSAKKNRAKALLDRGYTTAEVAAALGVSASKIQSMEDLDG